MGLGLLCIGKKEFSDAVVQALCLPDDTRILEVEWDIREPAIFQLLVEHEDLPEYIGRGHVCHVRAEGPTWMG